MGQAYVGSSVALSADGNTAILGAVGDNANIGAAWVFTRSSGIWAQQGNKLVGSGNVGLSAQGSSVAISADGKTIMVGGSTDNKAQGWVGAVWVYVLNSGSWSQQGSKLVGAGYTGGGMQGQSVALSADGNTAVEGGWADNADQGGIWVFTRNGNTWAQQGSELIGTGNTGAAAQGFSVAISADGNMVAEGGQQDNNQHGAVWVFTRSGNAWTQQGSKFVGAGGVETPAQGTSVALSANGTTMLEGGASDNFNIGATWVFTLPNDASLTALTVSGGTLSPVFASATNNYNVSVTNTTTSVTVTPTISAAGATVKINGVAATSGSASAPINLNTGANNISVAVTAPDGTTTNTYVLTVIRAAVAAPNIAYAGPQTYPAAVKIANAGAKSNSGGVPVPAIAFSQTATFEKGSLSPVGVVVDASGNVFTTSGRYIWKIAPGGQPTVFAGSGADGHANGQGTAASFGDPTGLAIDAEGNLYTADAENNMIRKITPQGLVSTLAGNGNANLVDGADSVASFSTPTGVAVGSDGSVYVGDAGNKAIRKITSAGVSTIAVSSATDASYMFSTGLGITVDGANNIYIVDPAYYVIRKLTQTGAMNIIAGISGKQGYVDGPAASAQFDELQRLDH